ncbi:MAG TPA: hypothetical protein VFM34_11980 [Moraxellaceae bacterium]|nr:hypothetical protein [Moraxellaceae bacterium]
MAQTSMTPEFLVDGLNKIVSDDLERRIRANLMLEAEKIVNEAAHELAVNIRHAVTAYRNYGSGREEIVINLSLDGVKQMVPQR